ncbi:MAG: F0F1 ATP synthase subunit A [Bacteroidetes bacterium]|nr:F0F1 ATP synthase subunit A [Bacteroidota bacterium]
MSCKRLFSLFLLVFALAGTSVSALAQTEATPVASPAAESEAPKEGKGLNISQVIFGHVADAHEWHIFSIGETPVALPLPVIIYHPEKGFSVFSSSKIAEGESYEGYHLDKGGMKEKIVSEDGAKITDLSITKNILAMLVSAVILMLLMTSAAKKYKAAGAMKAPKGFQNALEVCIIFIRDEVAKPNLGHKYKKYLPLLLTIFFFIWINNLFGLFPGGANFTGNIAVTACLALVSFLVMLFSANKHYWGHMFNPPGVPFGIKLLLVPIEIISMFIKPVALTIRLFANMLAGHIIILSVICMIFIFGMLNKYVGIGFIPVSVAFSVFMFMVELLVAAIQAFIFATLTAVFIGQAIEENHSEETGQEYHVNESEIIA